VTALLFCAAAWALDPGDQVQVDLIGGGQIQGAVKSAGPTSLALTGGNQEYQVSLALVEAAWINGEQTTTSQLKEEAAELYHRQSMELSRLKEHSPRPLLVFGTSMLWPGTGHLLLGERSLGLGYAVLELVLVSTGVFFAATENYQSLVPLIGVETLFRIYAVSDATSKAKRRRARIQAAPVQGGMQLSISVALGPIHQPVLASP
jgi:hypothetical protein